MFHDASDFNQPIGKWNVLSVMDMTSMFQNAYKFNQDISSWNVSSVTTMSNMFHDASDFNKPIGKWNVLSVKNMYQMFNSASSFNQSLYNWKDIIFLHNLSASSTTINVQSMLTGTTSLQYYILTGDVSNDNIYQAVQLYENDPNEYNFIYKPITSWNTSSIVDMSGLFKNTTIHEDIGNWIVSNVTNMESMFQNAIHF